MVTEIEMALLAYRVYGQSLENRVTVPSWVEDKSLSISTSSGFAGSVYTKDNEVVSAFRGTDLDSTGPIVEDFWNGNIPVCNALSPKLVN